MFVTEQFNKNDLHSCELNYKFLVDFENFLRNYKPIGHNGAMTHLIRLKKMINLAIKLEWMAKSPFGSYKIKIFVHNIPKYGSNNYNPGRFDKIQVRFDRRNITVVGKSKRAAL